MNRPLQRCLLGLLLIAVVACGTRPRAVHASRSSSQVSIHYDSGGFRVDMSPGKPTTVAIDGVEMVFEDGVPLQYRGRGITIGRSAPAPAEDTPLTVYGAPLVLVNGTLRVGTRGYGTVATGDRVAFEVAAVRVNGEHRGAAPAAPR